MAKTRRGVTAVGVLAVVAATLTGGVAQAAAVNPHKVWSPPHTALPKTRSVAGAVAPKAAPLKPRYQVPGSWSASAPKPTASASTGLRAPRMLAAATATAPTTAGGAGDYTATSLSPTSSWSAGTASGGFTYSYPLDLPPTLGGAQPNVKLDYDSSSVDGRTSASNAQASWIGDGWDYNPGFIERSYFNCDKHGITGSADRCWAGDNATITLPGHSGEMVKDDSSGVWHLKNDDGVKIEFLTGANNGANNGEYVKVTDNDGTAYYFGLNHLPGGDGTDPATNSAWSLPVYSPTAGQPCYNSAQGAASWCNMPWRWNLDYAVDTHGNLTTYNYAAEANYYSRGGGQNSGNGTLTAYTRGGSLVSIRYGQRLSDQLAAKGANKSAAQVLFNSAPEGRCSTSGGFTCTGATISAANASHWPDVPYDQNCGSTGTCTIVAPTFWSNNRLASVTTQVLSGGAYKNADTYALTQSFPDPGDGTKPALWLASIQRTGQDGTAVTLPATSFTAVMLPNRVDGTNLVPAPAAFNRPRIQMVTTETGGQTSVDYNLPACSRLSNVMPASADTDTMACFNVKWYPQGTATGADPADDWFNHYTVKDITENDPVAGSPQKITNYAYGNAAWHRNDSALIDPKTRTWDQFRGFATVTTTTGDGNDSPKGQTRTVYLQGMNGDATAAGGTKSVTVADALGENVTDDDWLSGRQLESDSYTQAGGTQTEYTVTRATAPVTSGTHARGSGLPDLVSRYAATTATATTKSLKADGTWRASAKTSTTDSANGNRVTSVDETADSLPELCTRTSYASSSNPMLRSLVSEQTQVASACSATGTTANTVSGSRTLYDGLALGQAGGVGDATSALTLAGYDGTGTAQYTTTASTAYDAYGRTVSTTDPNATDAQHPSGATTTTAYAPAGAGELPATVTVTSSAPGTAANWTATTTHDVARGLALTSTDANGKVTTESYDALGRLTAVWLPGQATTSPANKTFAYAINGTTGPSTVTTSALGQDSVYHDVTVQLYDGLARLRQTQATPGISSYHGRLITDAFYDSQGRDAKDNASWYNDGTAPTTTLYTTPDASVPGQTRTVFDGQGRPTARIFLSLGQEQWRSTTAYPGVDRTDVTPAAGTAPTSTVTDARGHTTQRWQYRTATATGNATDADVSAMTYTPGGQIASRTDSTGKNSWTYGYDLQGHRTTATDPDTGTNLQTFDADGHVLTSTDGRGTTTTRVYDLLGRKTALYAGTNTSDSTQLLATWAFDTVANGKGKPAGSTRYVGGAGGDAYASTVYGYDNAYHSTGTTQTIPGKETGSTTPLTYTTRQVYNTISGTLKASNTTAVGDQPAETLNYSYDVNGAMLTFGSATTTYDISSEYDAYGRATRTTVNPWGTQIVSTINYDAATGHALSQYIDKQTAATGSTQQTTYTYNPAGHVTSVKDVPDNNPAQTDLQCFSYDYLGRLTTAWSDTGAVTTQPQPSVANIGGCADTTPTGTTVGGPSAYWQSYSYDLTGNRTGLVKHDPSGNTANDVSVTETYPAAGQTNTATTGTAGTGGPHALLSAGATSYQYDTAGDTTQITNAAGTATLSWDTEGKLLSLANAGGTTGYVYGADGGLLVRHSPGKTTIFLGTDELNVSGSTLADTRYYALPDGLTGVRTGTALTFQIADPHRTNTLALDATTLNETRRPTDPFGAPRGTQPGSWADDKGFVGGIQDPGTGLTNLGAREYDPATGRFVNPDPLLVDDSPQQWNGYAYSNDDPVNETDPTGLAFEECRNGMYVCTGMGTVPVAEGTNYNQIVAENHKTEEIQHQSWVAYQNSLKPKPKPAAARTHFAAPGEHCTGGALTGVCKSPQDMRADARATQRAAVTVWKHAYASVSGCGIFACFNAGVQQGVFNFNMTGGPVFDNIKPAKPLLKGPFGPFAGASVGWNTATNDDNATTIASVTGADGPWGASVAYERNPQGKNFMSFGWAGGAGMAIQGPATAAVTWDWKNGWQWAGPK